MKNIWKFCILISFLVIFDQITKALIQDKFFVGESIEVIKNFFNFTYVKNAGAAFGMGASAPKLVRYLFFFFIPVLACFWLIWLIWEERLKSTLLGLAYSLILAGAIGNLIDRFSMGYVVDFLDFYCSPNVFPQFFVNGFIKLFGSNHFPAFNIADSAITVGGTLLVIQVIFFNKNKYEEELISE